MRRGIMAGIDQSAVPRPLSRTAAEPAILESNWIRTSAGLTVLAYATEFYDFVLYGVFAVVLGPVFFPSKDPALELLGAVGAFGVGFVVRPLGGVLTGIMADRVGRRRTLVVNLFLMAIGSAGIALVPPYARIGIAAPAIVVAFRILQGFAAAGNGTAALTLLIEHGGKSQRGVFGALALTGNYVGTLAGAVIGTLLYASLSTANVSAWGWRIAFLLGALAGPLGFVASRMVEETLIPSDAGQPGAVAPRIADDKAKVVWAALLPAGGAMCAYFTLFYLPNYASSVLRLPPSAGFSAIIAACLLGIAAGLLSGALSDRIGRRPVLVGAQICFLAVTGLGLGLLGSDPSPLVMLAVITAMSVTFAPQVCVANTWMTESFPKAIRGTGVGIALNIGGTMLGGLTPFAAAWLTRATGGVAASGGFVAAGILISLLAATQLKETANQHAD